MLFRCTLCYSPTAEFVVGRESPLSTISFSIWRVGLRISRTTFYNIGEWLWHWIMWPQGAGVDHVIQNNRSSPHIRTTSIDKMTERRKGRRRNCVPEHVSVVAIVFLAVCCGYTSGELSLRLSNVFSKAVTAFTTALCLWELRTESEKLEVRLL